MIRVHCHSFNVNVGALIVGLTSNVAPFQLTLKVNILFGTLFIVAAMCLGVTGPIPN